MKNNEVKARYRELLEEMRSRSLASDVQQRYKEIINQLTEVKSTSGEIYYNRSSSPRLLNINDKVIEIPADTKEDSVCGAIFGNKRKLVYTWSWDEILEDSGETHYDPGDSNTVYNAVRRINDKISTKTGLEKFLVGGTKTVLVNKKYHYFSLRAIT